MHLISRNSAHCRRDAEPFRMMPPPNNGHAQRRAHVGGLPPKNTGHAKCSIFAIGATRPMKMITAASDQPCPRPRPSYANEKKGSCRYAEYDFVDAEVYREYSPPPSPDFSPSAHFISWSAAIATFGHAASAIPPKLHINALITRWQAQASFITMP